MEFEGINIPLEDLEGHSFQPISSVETDPSQQSILHSLEATRNILIQGPPGTGKSQTLTAILVNALENNKKTIVVCEKITALEVLEKALKERGLNHHHIVIRDVIAGRKLAVESVRERVGISEYKRYRYNYSKESLDNVTLKAKNLISSINKKHQKVGEEIFGTKNWTKVVGKFLKEQKDNSDNINLEVDKNQFEYTTPELNILLDLVQKGQILYKDFLPIESTSFINSLKFVGDNPFLIEQSINDDFDFYSKQLEQIKLLLETNRSEYMRLRKFELKNQIASVNNCIENTIAKEKELSDLVSIAKDDFDNFRNIEFTKQLDSISQILSQIDTIFSNNKDNPDFIDSDKVNSIGYKVLSIFSKSKKHTIANHIELQSYCDKLEECLKTSKDFKTLNFIGSLESKKNSLPKIKTEITNIKNSFRDKIENEFLLFNLNSVLNTNDNDKFFHVIQSVINDLNNSEAFRIKVQSIQNTFKNYISETNSLFNALSKELSESKDIKLDYAFDSTFNENKKVILELKAKVELIRAEFDFKIQNEFKQISLLKVNPNEIEIKSLPILQEKVNTLAKKIKSDSWTVERIKFTEFYKFISDVEILIQKKNEYFKADKDLFTIEFKWFQFYNALSETEKTIINELKLKNNWRKTFLVFYLNSLLVNSANLNLPTSDDEHKELEITLNGVEKEQLKFIKEFWFSKQIDSTREFEQKNVNLSVENLYNKRSSNRFKRLSLRQIVQYDANLFSNFFPIILTSPDVASNLFKGMNGYFDIVMFDEASQLRLEDNLPAILKGKQIIIAGDEHQMPPSNYFSKVFDGSVEDEDDIEDEEVNQIRIDKDDVLLSCESLLDFGSELNFQRKHLDFHYRSRHPFLIDFSNYAFYNQRLKPLPNNFDYVPIKYVQVNGTFSEHTNEAEAEMVLSIIDKNINRLPNGEYPTVGIATFNIAQRNLIKSKILERQKFSKFEEFNAKIQELEEKGMFIKNLENIQGDERDVIILSTTYGIGKDGKFAQRFGPINHSKGYKLLNVIITRAKFKIYCCSSIPEQVFMNYKEYLTTEGSNNKRAVLYAYLAYCKAVSESNNDLRLSVLTTLAENTTKSAGYDLFRGGELESPFEEEVYQSLAEHLGTDKLYIQPPFAGFRIDIVYDPKVAGVPKVAIECDGAKYHSSREAYLYDRHRQKILENHGFVFHRIWSTNWWRNSSRELSKLLYFIKLVETDKKRPLDKHAEMSKAFTDDIVIIEDYISQTSFIDNEKDKLTIQTIEKVASIQTKIFAEEVKLNSKVHVKYVNNGKDITIHIVPTENNKNDKSDGFQKVYYKSPLAHSLIGQKVGEIVKIGNLDNFVEILKITN
jgi:superfamily I DNA and/or RNA helicase/transcription elongation GreA/GreB family factor/very-short-patch-repair endonuclease